MLTRVRNQGLHLVGGRIPCQLAVISHHVVQASKPGSAAFCVRFSTLPVNHADCLGSNLRYQSDTNSPELGDGSSTNFRERADSL